MSDDPGFFTVPASTGLYRPEDQPKVAAVGLAAAMKRVGIANPYQLAKAFVGHPVGLVKLDAMAWLGVGCDHPRKMTVLFWTGLALAMTRETGIEVTLEELLSRPAEAPDA